MPLDLSSAQSAGPFLETSPATFPLDPLTDSRYSTFLQHHPRSSVFHSVQWLKALNLTYGFEPIAFSTAPPQTELQNAVILCKVSSALTGSRLVSLPFSDHCDILATPDEIGLLAGALKNELRRQELAYIEVRPVAPWPADIPGPYSRKTYCFHEIDLTPSRDTLFKNCHRDSTQRVIRRAQRNPALVYDEGRSATLLNVFYELVGLTRRRHGVPPQPKKWFESLMRCFGDDLKIRVAYDNRRPIATILTLRYKDTLVYKYGGSSREHNRLGGMHLLLWRSLEDAQDAGLRVFDLGRSDVENHGLILFKDRWGARRSTLTYIRLLKSSGKSGSFASSDWKSRVVSAIVARLPERLRTSACAFLYKHAG